MHACTHERVGVSHYLPSADSRGVGERTARQANPSHWPTYQWQHWAVGSYGRAPPLAIKGLWHHERLVGSMACICNAIIIVSLHPATPTSTSGTMLPLATVIGAVLLFHSFLVCMSATCFFCEFYAPSVWSHEHVVKWNNNWCHRERSLCKSAHELRGWQVLWPAVIILPDAGTATINTWVHL